MLLSAMHALHSESTARISHISGAIIRFATLHVFHRMIDLGDEDSLIRIKAWSSAYVYASPSSQKEILQRGADHSIVLTEL